MVIWAIGTLFLSRAAKKRDRKEKNNRKRKKRNSLFFLFSLIYLGTWRRFYNLKVLFFFCSALAYIRQKSFNSNLRIFYLFPIFKPVEHCLFNCALQQQRAVLSATFLFLSLLYRIFKWLYYLYLMKLKIYQKLTSVFFFLSCVCVCPLTVILSPKCARVLHFPAAFVDVF